MKWSIVLLTLVGVVATGCAGNKSKNASRGGGSNGIPPMNVAQAPAVPAAPPAQFTPPPPQPIVYDAPVQQQPVIEESAGGEYASLDTPSRSTRRSPGGSGGGGTRYKVKRGESLWSIAEAKYGNGNKWKAIAAANPGVNPNRIQAGQTIVLP